MDRRLHPATDRIAHISLRGQAGDLPLTGGAAMEIAASLADLHKSPDGPRIRQLVLGEGFCVVDTVGDHSFGFARKDGYCGWLRTGDLRAAQPKTHWVSALASHLYPAPRVQSQPICTLPFGANLQIIAQEGNFAQTDLAPEFAFVPLPHVRELGTGFDDPVAVAETFLGCPYLWGGNSAAGLDCSGLVQAALLACGHLAPADSDLQASLGQEIPPDTALARGDLLFWRGHVAIVVDALRLIHANGHSMSVAYENIAECVTRISAAGGGAVTARRRF